MARQSPNAPSMAVAHFPPLFMLALAYGSTRSFAPRPHPEALSRSESLEG
jgi:hypothetical protein